MEKNSQGVIRASRIAGAAFGNVVFWEHAIRSDDDLINHVDYIHYNPVKHGLVKCPHDWRYSSFHRYVAEGVYPQDWACACKSDKAHVPKYDEIARRAGE